MAMEKKTHKIQTVTYEGITFHIDNEGFLVNAAEWNEFVATAIAKKEGKKELTPDMLEILYCMRDYYKTNKVFPSLTLIAKSMKKSRSHVLRLFGSHATAWKIAGLPQPTDELSFLLGGL